MIGCGFLEVFPVKLRNMERLVVKLLVGKINFLVWRLRNPVGDFLYCMGDSSMVLTAGFRLTRK